MWCYIKIIICRIRVQLFYVVVIAQPKTAQLELNLSEEACGLFKFADGMKLVEFDISGTRICSCVVQGISDYFSSVVPCRTSVSNFFFQFSVMMVWAEGFIIGLSQ
jgi:hypothetical protein